MYMYYVNNRSIIKIARRAVVNACVRFVHRSKDLKPHWRNVYHHHHHRRQLIYY